MLRALDDVLNFEQDLGSKVVCFLFVEPKLSVLWEVLVFYLFNLNLSAQDVPVAHSIHQVNDQWLPVILNVKLKRLLVNGGFTTLHIGLHHFICLVHHHKTLLDVIPQVFSPHHEHLEDALLDLGAAALGLLEFDLVFFNGLVGLKDTLLQLLLTFDQLVLGVNVVVYKLVQLNSSAVVLVAFGEQLFHDLQSMVLVHAA